MTTTVLKTAWKSHREWTYFSFQKLLIVLSRSKFYYEHQAGASDDYPFAKYQLSRRDRNSVQNTQHEEHWASPREFCSFLEFFKSGEREVGKICSYKTDKLARGNDINGR